MVLMDVLKFVYNHPLNKTNKLKSVFRFLSWQVSSRLFRGDYVYEWIENSKLVVCRGMTGATGNIYVGLMEYKEMGFLLHYLSEKHMFYDIGANVGVYTVLASKVRGAKCVSIEPLPTTYEKLLDNICINRISDNVKHENIGLSNEAGRLHFTNNLDTMNAVSNKASENTTDVEVFTLDYIVSKFGMPNVIKIDVEGFESNVIKGGLDTLRDSSAGVIIIELNGSGKRYGFDDSDIHDLLLSIGFSSFDYDPFTRQLVSLNTYGAHNTIYIKNSIIGEVKRVVMSAEKVRINATKLLL